MSGMIPFCMSRWQRLNYKTTFQGLQGEQFLYWGTPGQVFVTPPSTPFQCNLLLFIRYPGVSVKQLHKSMYTPSPVTSCLPLAVLYNFILTFFCNSFHWFYPRFPAVDLRGLYCPILLQVPGLNVYTYPCVNEENKQF